MGKTGKWFKSFLTGKKDQKTSNVGANFKPALADTQNPTTPVVMPRPSTPKEKRGWSCWRSSAAAVGPEDPNPQENAAAQPPPLESETHREIHALAVAAANAKAADAAVVAVQAAEEVIGLSNSTNGRGIVIDEAAAVIKIQSVFRSYLARKALKALRGLVKLQALVRGHLVRKKVTATLRCMQALVTAQARAHAHRIRTVEDGMITNQHISPAPSAIIDMSPRTCIGHFEDYSFATAQSSPQCYSTMSRPDQSSTLFAFPKPNYAETMSYDYPLYPNYMENTESSRAKARSQSAPRQRPEFERQPSRGRRASVEGRGIPRGARMQLSSSHVLLV